MPLYPRATNKLLQRVSTLDTVNHDSKFPAQGHAGVFRNGIKAGIQPAHAAKLARQLRQLNDARVASDMNVPGWKWHALSGKLAGHWAVWVNGNWRLTFAFDGEDAVLVDYQDYH